MKVTGQCPKCRSTQVPAFGSVRAGGGSLSVGDFAADAFTVFSPFDASLCLACGFTELYRKIG